MFLFEWVSMLPVGVIHLYQDTAGDLGPFKIVHVISYIWYKHRYRTV